MSRSRRDFLTSAAVAATCAALPLQAHGRGAGIAATPAEIKALFAGLPGDVGWKIAVPAQDGAPEFVVESGASKRLFAASSLKTFVLCELLRQLDAPDVVARLEEEEVTLDSGVWSLGSPIFNPPDLAGLVSLRTTLEAMISRSDNTATDMAMRRADVAEVRRFIADAGLSRTQLPDSTRALSGHLFGAPDAGSLTWEELLELAQQPMVNPFLNDRQTFASTAEDLVSYYVRALQGEFFQHPETLHEFRRILTLCDYIYLIPLPSGVAAHAKSGNADIPGFHARAIAGGLDARGRWIYFAFLINWYDEAMSDPATLDHFFGAIHDALALAVGHVSLGGPPRPPLVLPRRLR